MNTRSYVGKNSNFKLLNVPSRFSSLFKLTILLVFLNITCGLTATAQVPLNSEKPDSAFHYDEISVLVVIDGYGNFFSDMLYSNNDLLYVNVSEVFRTLKIPCTIGKKGDSIGGFIDRENQPYVIDFNTRHIKSGSKTINAQNGLVKVMGTLYLESSLFSDAFGIDLKFNFRSLAVILKSNFELPVIKQTRLEKLRNNVSKLKGEVSVDTILQRNYHFFRGGMVDWSLVSTQTWNQITDDHFKLGVGCEFLYGEVNISADYYNRQPFDNRQMLYLWRWVDNSKSLIKQAQVGKLSSQTISVINSPVVGVAIRNSPTTIRKAKGYYPINEYTEPTWTVELYINNILVDYTKADASGLYSFKVPIVYGSTTLKLKFYGPMGEERVEERIMNIPYTVMPVNELEYSLAAGVLQDSSYSRFGQAEFNYGVSRIFTAGGGVEYLSSNRNSPLIPYTKMTIQPVSKLVLNGTYAHRVMTSVLMNYYFMKDSYLEVDYTRYVPGQLAIPFKPLEERKIKLSLPFRIFKMAGYTKMDYTQLVYKEFNYNQANIIISLYYQQININSSTQFSWISKGAPYATSDLSISYRMQHGYNLRSSAQYNLSSGNFVSFKADLEKRIPEGYLSLSYERNIRFNQNSITVTFKYDLPFVRTNFYGAYNNSTFSFSEGLQGSLALGSGNNYIHASNLPSTGKGGISLYPYLDLNNNGIRDNGEHLVKLNSLKIMGNNIDFRAKDSIVRIPGLNPFTNYVMELNDHDLENIAWRFNKKIYSVLIDPNQFKRIEIPVISVGEVSGMAYLLKDNSTKGIERILVKIYKKNGTVPITQVLSEPDGYIYYIGLAPGDYVARVDSEQLNSLDYLCDPPEREFTIKMMVDGDIVGGIDFTLKPK